MAKNKSVLGIYSNRNSVENAIGSFRDAGFARTDISVLLPENLGPKELATQKETKAPEGATAGAGSGAVIGGTLGWLVGIGALAIPGLGPFIAAGPIMAALAGIGVGGAVGGFAGVLVGLGIPEYEAKSYEAVCKKAESCSPCTATLPKRSMRPSTSWSTLARKTSPPPANPLLT